MRAGIVRGWRWKVWIRHVNRLNLIMPVSAVLFFYNFMVCWRRRDIDSIGFSSCWDRSFYRRLLGLQPPSDRRFAIVTLSLSSQSLLCSVLTEQDRFWPLPCLSKPRAPGAYPKQEAHDEKTKNTPNNDPDSLANRPGHPSTCPALSTPPRMETDTWGCCPRARWQQPYVGW